MTTMAIPLIGASSTRSSWNSINWKSREKAVRRLQMRIAKAIREKRYGKAKALQWLLTHSFSAKLLAVRRVTLNPGRKTAGVDGKIWQSNTQKLAAVKSLQRKGYKPLPLHRLYIPKKNNQQRPLSIPTMKDRGMQALHKLALEPIVETQADKNAYGFRPKRSVADAIEQCFRALAGKYKAQWILEGDIKACFDRVSHGWLLSHVMMDKNVLSKWLAAGYLEKGKFHPTKVGTPQGGIISPTLLNVALSGLEQTVRRAVKGRDKVNVVVYADDFIITGASKDVLENKVKPTVEEFLKERGLELSEEKTKITHIDRGFDFLGFNVRKYNGKLLIKPSKTSINSFLQRIRKTIKRNKATTTLLLIKQLNPKIIGWANFYRHVVAKKAFSYVDDKIALALWRWIARRHPKKNRTWRRKKYFHSQGLRNWIFFSNVRTKEGKSKFLDLHKASSVPIKRHVKIKAKATPFEPTYKSYFARRERQKKNGLVAKDPAGEPLAMF